MTTDLATHHLEEVCRQMRGHKRMGEAAMSQLSDEHCVLRGISTENKLREE